MTIDFRCGCGEHHELPHEAAGEQYICSACGRTSIIGGAGTSADEPAAAQRVRATTTPYTPSIIDTALRSDPVSPMYLIALTVLTAGVWIVGEMLGLAGPDKWTIDPRTIRQITPDMLQSAVPAVGVFCAILLLGAFMTIALPMFLHGCWAALPPGWRRTSPRRAIGLLFWPIFNLLWLFWVVVGLAVDLNRFVDQMSISTRRAPVWLALAFCVLTICGPLAAYVPVWGPVVMIAVAVVWIILPLQLAGTVNGIVEARLAGKAP